MRGAKGEEPNHLSGTSVSLQPCATLAASPPFPVKPSDEESQHFDHNLERDPESDPFSLCS